MKMVVFGATGGTGRYVVERALAAGHEVIAVARKPEAVTAKGERLHVVKGDVLDRASVASAITGAEAVISSIGPADNKHPGTLISDGLANIAGACEAAGVRRLVLESGLMVGDGRGLGPLGKIGVAIYRRMYKALCADKRVAEATITASSLDWVIVRPVALDHSPARGTYTFGVDARLHPTRKLSHADVAEFLVRVATEPQFVRTIQDIGR